MQYPPNTVSITAEELLPLKEQGIDLLVHNRFCNVWSVTHLSDLDINLPEFKRIAAHDYRHYFGEVVDLKEHVTGSVLQYMGDAFILTRDDEPNYYTLYECIDNGYPDRLILTDLESQCKKIVIDYFTALFKKDLPHLNIKFIWS